MWCEKCQTEVAASVAADGSVTCGTCGETLTGKTSLDDHLRQAQDLLDRWSKEPLLEPLGSMPGKDASHLSEIEADLNKVPSEEEDVDSVEETPTDPVANSSPLEEIPPPAPPRPKANFRFDAAHLPVESQAPAEPVMPEDSEEQIPAEVVTNEQSSVEDSGDVSSETPEAESVETPQEAVASVVEFQPRRIDAAQPVAMHSAPHIDIQQLIEERLIQEKKGINWLVLAGQWLSYLGVLGLTAGAALIVYGYFGGNPHMTPKGWMLTTAGQMLLLLGIVTLISGGLEQSNDEVNTRIELLGEQMLRFERETKESLLRGPKIPAAQYAEDAKPAESNTRADKTTDA